MNLLLLRPDELLADGTARLWNASGHLDLIARGAKPCGLGARDTLRLEAGMNLYGQDMDEGVSPLDAGLAWTVALEGDREFVGREALRAAGSREAVVEVLCGLAAVAGETAATLSHVRVVTGLGSSWSHPLFANRPS